jgi:FtsP/CotA-like multicopper oxidase with cupredoxin domain/fibronectin type 3 domain-containing protein
MLLVAVTQVFGGTVAVAAPDVPAALEDRRDQVIDYRQMEAELRAARAEAAANLQAQKKAVGESGIQVSASIAGPNMMPDYFGDPNWAYSPPLAKFVDQLPSIPQAVPDTTSYPGSDYYEIGLVQYTQKMHRDLPPTTLRGYVQLNNPSNPATKDALGHYISWPQPKYLGPIIVAQRGTPVRIKFVNLLPTGAAGDLFVPVDETVMGAGMGPLGHMAMPMNYTQNRGTLHLHGGRTTWISDGTPHQWITPADEMTPYKRGVGAVNVPDMPDPGDGAMTFYWSNDQSARLMFYHDHAYGITRLNVYVGEAAGYLIEDPIEQDLVDRGFLPAEQIPLIIQDKTFVDASTVSLTDPTWNWGTGAVDALGIRAPHTGDLWYPHVYVPAQNPYDITGANPFGRWHYGPWFWPPTTGITYGPVPNPYYDPLLRPWEPPMAPGVPYVSAPGEAFMDTAVVNGMAFPTLTVQPKAYRLRILNAADDRFFNLQWYVADATQTSIDPILGLRTNTEVKMLPAQATAGWPESWPTDGRAGGVPDPTTKGPDWIQIGNESGFLPAPAVIPAQPIAWNMNPTTFNFGNVSDHSLLLGTAERADVIVDFSQFAGKTLILYNDAPAAFPALDPRYDYYTGAPDLSAEGGHAGPQAGFGPNTRTVMQVVVSGTVQPAYDVAALEAEWSATTGSGVFRRAQDDIIVGQSAYNSAYNTTFPSTWPNWGIANIQSTTLSFLTTGGATVSNFPMKPKAIQDEMGEAFDKEYGRMMGMLGIELPNTNAQNQNFVLQGYIDPATEIIDELTTGVQIGQIGDNTQIWKITHNGVDTHTIHFHLFDVQLINRVGWDGAIRLPDANELGWKETIRVSPLEDTIVALRPITPKVPFGVPDSVRNYDTTMPTGSTAGFTNIDTNTGQPLAVPVINLPTNFGWEYVWHCHILAHEEMDMMRPVIFRFSALLPAAPVLSGGGTPGTGVNLSWTDGTPKADPLTNGNHANEIGFRIMRAPVISNVTGTYTQIGAALANQTTFVDNTASAGNAYSYKVVAYNTMGDATSNEVLVGVELPPAQPTGLHTTAVLYNQVDLAWTDAATNETGYYVQRAPGSGGTLTWTTIATLAAGSQTYSDTTVAASSTYSYRVVAFNGAGDSTPSNTVVAVTPVAPPAAPTNLRATSVTAAQVVLAWTDNANNETGYYVERSSVSGVWSRIATLPMGTTGYTDRSVASNTRYSYRVLAYNSGGNSAPSNTVTVTTPVGPPVAPSNLTASAIAQSFTRSIVLNWSDNSNNETSFEVYRSNNQLTWTRVAVVGANVRTFTNTNLARNTLYYYRVRAVNALGASAYSNIASARTAP